jgi:polysaccharide pyruvyl transferase WcaK-like protein
MRVLLLNDNSAHLNWGAQATPFALMKLMREIEPGIEISAIPHAWFRRQFRRLRVFGKKGPRYRVGGIRYVNPFLSRFSDTEHFFPAVADDFDRFLDEWKTGRGGPPADDFLPMAQRADVVVMNGENTNYRNTVEAQQACFLLWLSKRLLGKPAAVINLTAHLNSVRPILNGMIQRTYPNIDQVETREPRSCENLHHVGVANATSSADVVFGLRPADFSTDVFEAWKERVGLQKPYFCVSTSGLPASRPNGPWDGQVTELVRALREIVPNVVLVAKDGSNQFLKDVSRRTGAHFFGPEHEFHELWPLFEDAEFLVSGHFHYLIFAAMVGCPFVPLSANNHKMQGLCEQLEWPTTEPFDVTFLQRSGDGICRTARELTENRAELSRQLVEKSGELAQDVVGTVQRTLALARQGGPRV